MAIDGPATAAQSGETAATKKKKNATFYTLILCHYGAVKINFPEPFHS